MFSSGRQKLRLAQFNVENLFVYMDRYKGQDLRTINNQDWQAMSSSTTPNKPIDKAWAIARTIKDLDADVVMLNEVGGEESIKNFCNYFLDNAYVPYLIEGNSHRGIDVGSCMAIIVIGSIAGNEWGVIYNSRELSLTCYTVS